MRDGHRRLRGHEAEWHMGKLKDGTVTRWCGHPRCWGNRKGGRPPNVVEEIGLPDDWWSVDEGDSE